MNQKKTKLLASLSFIAAIITAVVGVIMFILGIMFFITLLKSGKSQSMSVGDVFKYFYDQGNLNAIFEPILQPIALYGGISIILFTVSNWLKSNVLEEEVVVNELDTIADETYSPEYSFEESSEEAAEEVEEVEEATEETSSDESETK